MTQEEMATTLYTVYNQNLPTPVTPWEHLTPAQRMAWRGVAQYAWVAAESDVKQNIYRLEKLHDEMRGRMWEIADNAAKALGKELVDAEA